MPLTSPHQKPNSSTIALVTVLFNCEKHLTMFFESLASQTDKDFLTIIIDNQSKDESMKAAQRLAAEYQVKCIFIQNENNLGIAIGNNQGIECARKHSIQHIVLINNDIGCDSDLIAQIRHKAINAGHLVWTCLAYYGDTQQRWYGGGKLNFWLARGIHFNQSDSEKIKTATTVTYAPTCLMYVHSTVFDTVGMMDPDYFVYYDDTDFCKRLQHHKINIIYDPSIFFRHYVGGSSGGDLSPFSIQLNTRNKFIYIEKNYPRLLRGLVLAIAIISKLVQISSKKKRPHIIKGLRQYFSK